MSYSWILLGEFEIPADRLATFQDDVPPMVNSLEEIVEDAGLNEVVYDGSRMYQRMVFEKSLYGDFITDGFVEDARRWAAAGVTGTAHVVGFVDGGPDGGRQFTLADGELQQNDLSRQAAKKISSSRAYEKVAERFWKAFEDFE